MTLILGPLQTAFQVRKILFNAGQDIITTILMGNNPTIPDYLLQDPNTLEDDGTDLEQPTFNLETGITISIPPLTILDVGINVDISQSPEYELVRNIPTPDIPKRDSSTQRTQAVVTRFKQDSAVTLLESISERKFGCLLHEPIRENPVKIKRCKLEVFDENEQKDIITNFAKWLGRNILLDGVNDILEAACDLSVVALTLFTGPGLGQVSTIIGCKILKYYFLDQISANLTITSIGVQSSIPTSVEEEDCDDIPIGNDGNKYEICNDLNTCFVPIRNLRSNLPGGEGYKKQLQIVFSLAPNSLDDVRQITIPSPINPENITKDLILEAIYGFVPSRENPPVKFGKVKYEIDVTPYGYIRFYGKELDRPYQEVRDMYKRFSDKLIAGEANFGDPNDPNKVDTFRASDRERSFSLDENGQYVEMDLYPVKALLFDFSNPANAKCTRWDLRYKDPNP